MDERTSPRPSSSIDRDRLSGLLKFGEGLLSARDKALMAMRSTGLGHFPESRLVGLPGLRLGAEEEVWLRLQRLRETPPPAPPEEFPEWFEGRFDHPDRPPSLHELVVREVDLESASDLCEGGLVDSDEIERLDDPSRARVVLRLERLSEWRETLEAWVGGPWSTWAAGERPRRLSIALYNKLYQLHNQMHGGAVVPPELVWGIGIATWRTESAVVDMPLLEQLVDIEVEAGGDICIVPRATPLSVTLRPFLELEVDRAAETQSHLQGQLASLVSPDDPDLDPFETGRWEPLLAAAATRLSAGARFISRDELLDGDVSEEPTPTLTIRSSWTIYGRPRSDNQRLRDLESLRKTIEGVADDADLPDGLRGFVSIRSDGEDGEADDWGLTRTIGAAPEAGRASSSDAPRDRPADGVNAGAYFFPLPYNEEQARIIDRLEREAVVTVTGPPGTGKTHTIANIVSHYMAVGKRVLVTARTAEAIAAVREKLPEELASLVVASVGSDKDGNRQMQAAIERLSAEVVSFDTGRMLDEKARLEAAIVADDRALAELDAQLAAIASANLGQLDWQGRSGTPMEVLERLQVIADQVAWFTDRPTDDRPEGLEDTIDALRTLLPELGADLSLAGADVPVSDDLPGAQELIDVHAAERAHRGRPVEDFSDQPPMDRSRPDAEKRARDLEGLLSRAAGNVDTVSDWVRTLSSDGLTAALAGQGRPPAFEAVVEAAARVGSTELRDVFLVLGDADRDELDEAVARGCRGARAVPLFGGLFRSNLVKALESIRVDGSPPADRAGWRAVADHLAAAPVVVDVAARWEAFARAGQLPSLPAEPAAVMDRVRRVADRLPRIEQAIDRLRAQAEPLEELFPTGLAVRRHLGDLDFAPLLRALRANVADDYRSPAAIERLRAIGERRDDGLFRMIATLAAELGTDALDDSAIVVRRNALTAELARVHALAPTLDDAVRRLERVADAGAPELAERLRREPAAAVDLLPPDWQTAWDWAVARRRVESVIALGNGDGARRRRAELRSRRERTFEALIRTRTLLGLKRRLTPSVQTALKMFTAAVTKLGKGTGKSAPKWRRAIREAAMEAAPAAPVWIMPEYKIAEQLPASIGDFDLVILDEASQSDLTSIGSLARGARQLIVGDEKQVSPSSVGIPVNKVAVLVATHLRGLPNAAVVDQETSIFDFAQQMHPTSNLMLREHFRCVEPIIGFSAGFYDGRLVPLRIAKASERFDPPLVDVHVKGARRTGKTNESEADVVVEEIAELVGNPEHAARSIAVISLIGGEQAELIERRLMEDPRIGTRMIDRHRILCGDSRTMQGQERDIVLLSMVATPDTVVSDSKVQTTQRLNVALSRARDRMYLVRSVSLDDLKTADLKRRVLEHFADPMPAGRRTAGNDVLERCESGFEREVCGRLLEANYRVKAQVSAGPYRIDLVVEGAEDRRLAIELDGDRWHGPDRWHDDMVRQAALERAGWTFWRVFGTQWLADRDYWWGDLTNTLATMGIEPIGAQAVNEVYTEFRTVVVDEVGSAPMPGDDPGGESRATDDRASQHGEPAAASASADRPVPSAGGATVVIDEGEAPRPVPTDIDLGETAKVPASGETAACGGDEPSGEHGMYGSTAAPSADESPEPVVGRDGKSSGDRSSGNDTAAVRADTSMPLHDAAYRPALADRVREIVAESGPVDLHALCRTVAAEHGLRRVGGRVRAAVRAAAAMHLSVVDAPEPGCSTVWPEGATPATSLPCPSNAASKPANWDSLCWPARVGLVAHAIAESPPDLHRAVLERLANRSLTRRLIKEMDAVAEHARSVTAPPSGRRETESMLASPMVESFRRTRVIAEPSGVPCAFNAARLDDRAVDELIGLCRGVLADGTVSQDEAEFLLDWLETNRATATHWPANVLFERISRMLEDGVLDDEEEGELLSTLLQVTGDPGALQRGDSAPSTLPLCDPAPRVDLVGRSFCLTGKFVSGTRAAVTGLIERAGGRSVPSVSGKLDYLVIGSVGSAEWMHSTHGRKIEKAIELRARMESPWIIDEQTLVEALGG